MRQHYVDDARTDAQHESTHRTQHVCPSTEVERHHAHYLTLQEYTYTQREGENSSSTAGLQVHTNNRFCMH